MATTKMEKRNNELIAKFLDGKQDALLWASRVSGMNLDEMIEQCLYIGWEGFTAELQYFEEHDDSEQEGEE